MDIKAKLIEKLEVHFKKKEPSAALDLIVQFEEENDSVDFEILRFKSRALSILGKREKSLETLKLFLQDSTNLSDWHLASEIAIELGCFSDAKGYLSKTIELSLKSESDYFLQTCYLERAFVKIELQEFESAFADLNQVNEAENIFWLKGIKPINKKSLLSKCIS